MFLKSCIFLALTCAVKASVIISVYDENKADDSVRDSCNYQACDQLCRRLGFPGGACVGDKCKCDNFEPIGIKDVEVKAPHYLYGCDPDQCQQKCLSAGFKHGICLRDICRCTPFADLTENKADHSVNGHCNYQACDQLCRRLGFPGGACVGDKCKCDNFEPIGIKGKALDHLLKGYKGNKEARSLEKCYLPDCEKICRHFGYPVAACDGDNCICSKGTEISNEVEDTGKGDNEENTANVVNLKDVLKSGLGSCDHTKCFDRCRRLNYSGGVCIAGQCICYHSLETTNSNNVIKTAVGCDTAKCNDMCRSLNHLGGICVGEDCTCF